MKIVISLGGSVISEMNGNYIKKFAEFVSSSEHSFYIVVGGGKIAREYISFARSLGADEEYLDRIGIMATRLNAMLLNTFFMKKIPETIEEAKSMSPPVIMGGTEPGHSTDAVAAMLAREVKADKLIIATNVDGIYDRDPAVYKDAKKFDRISINELRKMVGDKWNMAGKNVVVDAIACRIIDGAKIKTFVVYGKEIDEIKNAIYGREFKGTEIVV
ncbi:MAG: UMP kinase [Thermoplasmata archaeon]|nr:UMP kinase [Thermoplasmata archaeon]